jgi:hypothetical protein
MARIETYVRAASPISGADKLIGTDSANNNETKNFTIQEISDFVGLGPYKVYTALLTQSGGDNPQDWSSGSGPLILGYTYQISNNDGGTADFTNVGAPNNNVGTYFVATGTTPNSWGDSDNGGLSGNEAAPVVTVLQNTLGNVWFIYQNIGTYEVISDALFIADKTTCITSQSAYNDIGVTFIYRDNVNLIYIETSDFFTQTSANDILAGTILEIRVYS